jgi:hypothetical protein
MKKVFKLIAAASLSCLLFIGCTKNSSNPTSTSADTTNHASAAFISGNWAISSLTQRAEDKTSLFSGVVFTFSTAGKLTTTKSSADGTWSYLPSAVVYYGATPIKESLIINMGATKPMKELTRTWNIVSRDASTLSLVNPEPLDDEHLVFSKQ